jgi:hypothetical protein
MAATEQTHGTLQTRCSGSLPPPPTHTHTWVGWCQRPVDRCHAVCMLGPDRYADGAPPPVLPNTTPYTATHSDIAPPSKTTQVWWTATTPCQVCRCAPPLPPSKPSTHTPTPTTYTHLQVDREVDELAVAGHQALQAILVSILLQGRGHSTAQHAIDQPTHVKVTAQHHQLQHSTRNRQTSSSIVLCVRVAAVTHIVKRICENNIHSKHMSIGQHKQLTNASPPDASPPIRPSGGQGKHPPPTAPPPPTRPTPVPPPPPHLVLPSSGS